MTGCGSGYRTCRCGTRACGTSYIFITGLICAMVFTTGNGGLFNAWGIDRWHWSWLIDMAHIVWMIRWHTGMWRMEWIPTINMNVIMIGAMIYYGMRASVERMVMRHCPSKGRTGIVASETQHLSCTINVGATEKPDTA